MENQQTQEKKEGFWADHLERLQASKFNLFLTVVLSIVLMLAVCFAVFNLSLKGEEKVMVPNVVGKELCDALLEMQEKELYQKVQFRFTDDPDDAWKILSQSPEGGAIVKAGQRVNIVVSKGAVVSHVENFVGDTYDGAQARLKAMFSGNAKPLMVLADPSYKADSSPAGTVIAQDPSEGTPISAPVSVRLVVSKGSERESAKVPNLRGLSAEKVYRLMEATRLVFDFRAREAGEGERAGTVVSQSPDEGRDVPAYERVSVEFAVDSSLLADAESKKPIAGVFSAKVTKFPYAVQMSLEAVKDGRSRTLANFSHTGGDVSLPYSVERGTELVLSVRGKKTARELID